MTKKKVVKKKKMTKKQIAKLKPLKIEAKCVAGKRQILNHIKKSMELKMSEILPALLHHDGQVVVVGAGITVRNYVENIKAHQLQRHPIVAIKGAYDWLMEEGIVPDTCIMVDPQANQTRYFTHLNKHTKYLIASQCHPKLFKHFSGYAGIRWHALSNVGENELLQKYPGPHVLVTGGTTSGLRGICLTYMMGFAHFHLYGFDSTGNSGVRGHVSHEKLVSVYVNDSNGHPEEFRTTPAMAKQAEEFPYLFNALPGFKCHIYGKGLISAVVDEIKRKEQRRHDKDIVSAGDEQDKSLLPVQGNTAKRGTKKKRARGSRSKRS